MIEIVRKFRTVKVSWVGLVSKHENEAGNGGEWVKGLIKMVYRIR